jgi:RNA polymerase sigma-70 factor (ECF subfamily)
MAIEMSQVCQREAETDTSARLPRERDRRDLDLVEALADRRPGSFEALVRAYQNELFSFAVRVTGNREDAQDAVQEALLRVHRALFRSYTPERVRQLSLRPWLYTAAVNSARNRLRGRRDAKSLDETFADGRPRLQPASPILGPAALAEAAELARALERALLDLPARFRMAVVLRTVEGLSYQEVAEALGRPVGTVKSDVHRGLRKLRTLLEPRLQD